MLVLDTDKITGHEAIPYITGENQGIDEIKNICQKTICQFFVFLVNQDKNMVLIKLKKIILLTKYIVLSSIPDMLNGEHISIQNNYKRFE